MNMVIEENIMVPMRDGVKLATDVYRPAQEGQWPVLVTRVPYIKDLRFPVPGTTPLTGEHAQATLRGRPRGRLGTVGSGNGCVRGRPRGRFGTVGSETAFFRGRLAG